MKNKKAFILLLILALSSFQVAMARKGIYDEEARENERFEKAQAQAAKKEGRSTNPAKNIAGGVKQATVDSTTGFIGETVEGTVEEAPVKGTIEGANKGAGKILDNTLKGAVKVATLGYGDLKNYEVEEPKSKGDTSKIKIKIPGT